MVRLFITPLIIFCFAAFHSAGNAQDNKAAATTPCAVPEYRQLDFWVGDWELSWDLGDGKIGKGQNLITNSGYGTCVVTENFSMPGFTGMSVSTYDAALKKWRQTWVDDQGGYYALVGGPVEGEAHSFELVLTRLSDDAPHLRMIWQEVTQDSLKWRWQNRNKDNQWTDQWVIHYKRRTL